MSDKSVELGTLFTGKIADSLPLAITKLKAALNELNGVANKTTTTLKTVGTAAQSAGATVGKSAAPLQSFSAALKNIYTNAQIVDPKLRSMVSAMTAQTSSTNTSSASLKAFGISLGTTLSPLQVLTTALKSTYTNAKIVDPALRSAVSAMTAQAAAAKGTAKSLNMLGIALGRTATEEAKTGAAAKAASTQIANGYGTAAKGVNTFVAAQKRATIASKAHTGALTRLGTSFKTLASYMVAGRGLMLFTQALTNGIKEIGNFDQALKNLQAITSATDAQIDGMRGSLVLLAQTTKFSVTELAQGMVLLGQSGFSAVESMAAINSVAILASATLSTLESTAQLLTTTIRAYNLQAIESGRVADVMANAVNKSKLTIDKLNTSFNYVGVSASQAGLSVEQTAASMMVLANNGLRASTIGTGFRQVLMRLEAPNTKLRDAFKEQNIELSRVNPSVAGYENSLRELSKVLWDTEAGTVNMGRAFSLFGLRGAQAAAVIVKSYVGGQFDSALDQVRKVGTAQEMAAKQAEGLAFKFKNLQDVLGTLATAVGDSGLKGALVGLVDTLKNLTLSVADFVSSGAGSLVTSFTLLTAGIYGVIAAGKALIATAFVKSIIAWGVAAFGTTTTITAMGVAVSTVTGEVVGLQAVLGAISPVLMAVAAFSALAVGLYAVSQSAEKARKANEQELLALEKSISGYSLYSDALEELEKQRATGTDTQQEEAALIQRLRSEYKELAPTIDTNASSVEDLIAAIRQLKAEKEEQRIKTLIALYDKQKLKIQSLPDPYDELQTSVSDVAEAERDLKKAQGENENTTQNLVAALILQERQLGKNAEEIKGTIKQTLLASGQSEEFATMIEKRVIVALDFQRKKLAETGKSVGDYADIIIDAAAKSVSSLATQTASEQALLAAYKKGAAERAALLKSGTIGAEQYRQQNLAAEIKFTKDIITARTLELEGIKTVYGAKHDMTLAAQSALTAATSRLRALENSEIKKSYDVQVLELETQLAKKLIDETQFYIKSAALNKNHIQEQIAANADALIMMNARGKSETDEYEKLLKKKAELQKEFAEAQSVYAASSYDKGLIALQAAAKNEMEAQEKKYSVMLADGKASMMELSKQYTIVDEARDRYNSSMVDSNEESYEIDLANLKSALDKKGAAHLKINDQILTLESTHWKKVLDDTNASLAELSAAHINSGAEWERLSKLKVSAIDGMSSAVQEHTAVIEAEAKKQETALTDLNTKWDNIADQGMADYELAISKLNLAHDSGGISARKLAKESLEAYKTYINNMISNQEAYIASLKASGAAAIDITIAETTLIELQRQKTLALEEMNLALENSAAATEVSEAAWAAFAKKVGMTVAELKKVVQPLIDAKNAGKKSANVSEAAWAAFANKIGVTVEELKAAIATLEAEISEADRKLKAYEDRWRGQFTYVGGDGYFEQKFGVLSEMTKAGLQELDETMSKFREIEWGHGWWDEYNNNLRQYKRDISDALYAIAAQEAEVARQKVDNAQRDGLEAMLSGYKDRLAAHTAMTSELMANEDSLLAKIQDIFTAQKSLNADLASQERDIMREKMSSMELYADDMARVDDLIAKAKAAAGRGDMEASQMYLDDALSANAAFNNEYVAISADGTQQIIANEEEVRQIRLANIAEMKAINDDVAAAATAKAEKELAANKALMEQNNADLQFVNDQINEIKALLATPMTMSVDIDAVDALAVIAEIQLPTESIHTINVKRNDTGGDGDTSDSVTGFADGGVVPGVGTGDTVPAMLTPGEIVVPVPAIRSGRISEFISSILPNMNIPKLNIPVQKFASGGMVQSVEGTSPKRVQLDFNIGNKIHSVTAEESVGAALIEELKTFALVSG